MYIPTKFCRLSFILTMLMTLIFSETITIYGTQSARYTSNTSSSCCTPHSLHSYNESSMYTSSCWWHDVYDQCFENRNTAIWRFDLSDLPDDMQFFDATFEYDMSWCEYRGYIKTTNQTGPISTDLAYNLWNNSDWDQSLYDNLECSGGTHSAVIPQSQISYGSQSGQLNILMSSTDGYIDNSGLDAPRIVIEYEPFGCNDQISQDACESFDENCQWTEEIELGNCSNLGLAACEEYGCDVECGWYHGSCGGCCYYECGGGTYEIDTGFCSDGNIECNDQLNANDCESNTSCEWIEDITWGNCGNYNNSNSCNNAHPDCSWMLCYGGGYGDWYHCCQGGSFQNDNSYCGDTPSVPEASISFGNILNNMMEINYLSESHMGGFQFTLSDESNLITITDINGGLSEENDFTVSYDNDSGIVIGFSFSGGFIPRGEGLLTNIYYSYNYQGSNEVCLNDVIISNTQGEGLLSMGDCTILDMFIIGDMNNDSLLNILDIIALVNYIVNIETDNEIIADINEDNQINILDVITLVNIVLDQN